MKMKTHKLHSLEGEVRKPHLLCGCNSVVECKLPKLDVAGSNPVARFFNTELLESRIEESK